MTEKIETAERAQAQVEGDAKEVGVQIHEGRVGYDTRRVRKYSTQSAGGRDVYQHAKKRLSRWAAANRGAGVTVSGVQLSAETQAQIRSNICEILRNRGYTPEDLENQADVVMYKLIQANKLYHPKEPFTHEGGKLPVSAYIGTGDLDHKTLLKNLATQTLQWTDVERLVQYETILDRVEDAISDQGHAILNVKKQGRSFNTSKTHGYTEGEANRKLDAKEQEELDKALFAAVKNCSPIEINTLIAKGANLNALNEDGKTPLTLLDDIIDDEELDDKDLTEQQLEAYKQLREGMIRAKALTDDDMEDLYDDLSDLVEDGKVAEAQKLIDSKPGLTFNTYADKGDEQTFLHIALEEEQVQMAMHIINSGVNVNTPDEDGMTALHYVLEMDNDVPLQDRLALLQAIIAQKPYINAVDEDGLTAMDYVANLDEKEQPYFAQLLQQAGGMTAQETLFTAIKGGNLSAVKYLIQGGVDIDTTDENGFGVMHYAAFCTNNPAQMGALLLELGGSVKDENKDDATPLHTAVEAGNIEYAAFLLENEAKVNAKTDAAEDTPLHIAVRKGDLQMASLLLSKGAEASAENDADQSPFTIANDMKNVQMASLLRAPYSKEIGYSSVSQNQPDVQPVPAPAPAPAPALQGQKITTEQPQEGVPVGRLPERDCF